MICITHNEMLIGVGEENNLVAEKLVDCNGNIGRKCLVCEEKDLNRLYLVEYLVDDYNTVEYGVHCVECAKKIFKLKEMDKENKAVKNDTPLMFKDLAIRECDKIPSNSKILYKTTQVSHVIGKKIGELPCENTS